MQVHDVLNSYVYICRAQLSKGHDDSVAVLDLLGLSVFNHDDLLDLALPLLCQATIPCREPVTCRREQTGVVPCDISARILGGCGVCVPL